MYLAHNNRRNDELQLLVFGRKCNTVIFHSNNVTINNVLVGHYLFAFECNANFQEVSEFSVSSSLDDRPSLRSMTSNII
jgi:hypothetical protein